jgi:CBS-domain-containing membrane protein
MPCDCSGQPNSPARAFPILAPGPLCQSRPTLSDGRSDWPRSWHADASLPVSQYMQRGMRYVGLGMRADKIVQFMWDAGLTEVPVLDEAKRPVGLISLGELIASGQACANDSSELSLRDPAPWLPKDHQPSKRVEDIMVYGAATILQSMSLASAAARMVRSDREYLIVVDDDGVAVGSLSMADVMRWLVEQTSETPREIRGEMVTPGIARRRA